MTQQQETVTKQKNPLRIEQGRKLVEYNRHKKEELKYLNEQITKQDVMEHKPKPDTNTYVYVGDARGKFVSGAKVLAAVPRIWQPGSFISNF